MKLLRRTPRTLHLHRDGVHYFAPNPAWKPGLIGRLRDRWRHRGGRGTTLGPGWKDVGYYTPDDSR